MLFIGLSLHPRELGKRVIETRFNGVAQPKQAHTAET
jgi:hypothetical protein